MMVRCALGEDGHKGIPAKPHHIKNTLASETPATDGERLYVLFGNLGLFCYDLDGKLKWTHQPRLRTKHATAGARRCRPSYMATASTSPTTTKSNRRCSRSTSAPAR